MYRIENGFTKPSEPDTVKRKMVEDKTFVGDWEIGKSSPTAKPKFVMTLRADSTARKSHVPSATGKWEVVNGQARVVWSDGWRDIIQPHGNTFRKIAFRPGTDFDSDPDNFDAAQRSPK